MKPKIDHTPHAREKIGEWIVMAQCYSFLRAIKWLVSYRMRFKGFKFVLVKAKRCFGSWYVLRKS